MIIIYFYGSVKIKYERNISEKNMISSLLPIGEYTYNQDEYSFDEAWKNLEKCYHNKEFIVCFAVSESSDGKYINLDYHNIHGKIYRGYITQNRTLHNEYFINKTFCVSIIKLNKIDKSFVATHIPVEIEGKQQLASLKVGDKISGIISYIGGEGSYAFIDVKEGLILFVSARHLFWRPVGCQRIDTQYSIGDRIVGTISFLESTEKPRYATIGTLTCLDFEKNWALEINNLEVGKIVIGIPKQEILLPNMYYISYSQHVYIEFSSDEALSDQKNVKTLITEIDIENHLVKAVLVKNAEKLNDSKVSKKEDQEDKNTNPINEKNIKHQKTGSLFDLKIKATTSPFIIRKDEEKEFETTPNNRITFYKIQSSIKSGHLNKLHFAILKVINLFVFCTSKQIMASLYCNEEKPKFFGQDKLNRRLNFMAKLGLIDKIRFRSGEGEGIYRVYFLNKNGERLLTGFLGTKQTSYHEALLATPVNEIKRHLATNQIILAFREKFDFLNSFYIRRIIKIDNTIPIRVPTIMDFSNSFLLVETYRRYSGWKEDLVEKMKRYSHLFENYRTGALPITSQFLLNKQMYLLIVCENIEHALEIRNLLLGHAMYPFLFFTYDLLVFQKDINYSIFRFEGIGQEVTYYNVTELLAYNLYHTELTQLESQENEGNEKLADFQKCLSKGYLLGLEYLQKHNSTLLHKVVAEDLQDLYCLNEDGNYQPVYPEEQQYYIYLLFLINHKIVPNLTAMFHEKNTPIPFEYEDITIKGFDSEDEYSTPIELEHAVELILHRITKWCEENVNTSQFQITKRPLKQTAGVQYGYDVGMNFKWCEENYQLGFECKNYKNLSKKTKDGEDARLLVSGYAYNLLEFFMHCDAEKSSHNIWILICPFGNLQNNFYEKLFERWNKTISFMKIRIFCSSQSDITCEEFLSLDEQAYRSIYKHEPPELSIEEKNQLLERIFYTIVDKEDIKFSFDNILSKYPFDSDAFFVQDQMVLKTVQGENVLEHIFQKLEKNQNIFLVGEFGSGKTFMTYHIVRTIFEHQDVYPYFPLWFNLSDSTMELVHEKIETNASRFVKEGLKQYADFSIKLGKLQVLIILDGMDEIASGLGESELKLLMLEQICKKFKEKYASHHPIFLITSREVDFKSCMGHQQKVSFFNKYAKITIGECQRDDAIQKLQEIEKQAGWDTNERGWSFTHNSKLMNIVQKPLYFGFVREFILDQEFLNDSVDELDVLQAIVQKSIKFYIKNDSTLKGEVVYQQLCDWAREISIQMTNGGSSEILIYKWFLPSIKNNVIRLHKINEDQYSLQFYHNAIREYLVADELYKIIVEFVRGNIFQIERLEERLQKLELTPEMIAFFTKLVDKNAQYKEQIIAQIIKMLQSANQPTKQHFGINLFSILYHLKNELTNLDLPGIYANNLYFWNCSLKNINFQNANMRNLRLFNVNLENIDLRGTDLNGLIIGKDDKILDVQHYKWRNGFRIFVLYENKQLVEYQFSEYNCSECYEIIYHDKIEQREYRGFCPMEHDLLFYSDKWMFFETNSEKIFQVSDDICLLRIEPSFILIEQNHHIGLIMHNFKYHEVNIISLMPNEKNMLYVLDQKSYLYVDEDKLVLQQNEKRYVITYLNSNFECFTAIRTANNSQFIIYIKYSDDIQVIYYTFKESSYQAFKLPKYVHFLKMKVIKEDLLYGISDQIVYLFNLSEADILSKAGIQLFELQINVRCKNLTLENLNSSNPNPVKGEREYNLLKKAMRNSSTST